ncbi:unnamed protein product [Adineta steineri]|uniref:Afadin n=1 Tax=Adineta steineri TaxID=433720 RepID=A0A813Q348_9BILA|nr:unnamed protein product [Adineta steineri]CAF0769999.1 unnamed protein product [Adineta steineri]
MNGLPKDRSEVLNLINEWNSTRLDLFKISEPNEVLDFYGVMRFYFQDAEDKVTTKCIRVASTASSLDVIRVLMEKLRPDMKTLPNEKDYCIYEVHPNGDGRKLEMDEKPLWVQLYWGKDQREGRFVLQNAKLPKLTKPIGGSFKERRSSKRESKKKKKQDKKNGIDENDNQTVTPTTIVESLYKSVPETNKFTRSLSNPEMVKKIQQDRLKQKFIKISTKEGGGTMKVFGDALNPSIPYKTFLLSIKDTAEWVVKEMLEKYGLKHEDPQNYCLLQIVIPPRDQMDNKTIKEVILHDKECPLSICLNHAQKNEGSIMFKVVKCPPEYVELRRRLRVQESALDANQAPSIQDRTINDHLSMFVEVKNDGTDLSTPRVIKIHPNTTYVGRDAKAGTGKQYFYIDGVGIDRDHCTIHNQNGIVTLTPRGEVWLNGKLVSTPFVLQHGSLICFGRNSTFRYCDPQFVTKTTMKPKPQINGEKSVIHNSLSTLPMTGIKKSNQVESSTLQIRPPKDLQQKKPNQIVDPGTMIDVLPGLLEVPVETENRFIHAIFENYPLNNIQFRLSPVYTLYMALRHRLSPYGKPNFPLVQKQETIIQLLYRIEDMISKKIEECHEHGGYLAYWIANTSELLYFIKQDRDISKISHDIQDRLAECVQRLFRYLTQLVQNELDKYLISFTNPQDDVEHDIYIAFEENSSTNVKLSDLRWLTLDINSNNYHQATLGDILATLSSIMDLLRKCRVNAALTIQMFSQIFHYINTWLFNRMVCCPELKLCSHFWGEKLALRLKSISDWAQRQGLELASDCHLTKVNQICLLLQSPKRDAHDVQQLISNNTFKLNSIQIKQILNNYVSNRNEIPISPTFSQALLAAAYKHVDENLRREGVLVQLAEEPELNLPFLLPEDGYTCENLRGIPQQLFEFIEPMSRSSLCRLFTNPHSLGMWTEFMQTPNVENVLTNNNNTEGNQSVETVILNKKGNSLGLSIVAAKGESQQFQGIYIKAIVPGGAAEDDGRLQAGDQILCVDKISLIDITQEQAAEALKQCGPLVTLQVLKDAANRQGLSALLSKPSDNHHQYQQQQQQQQQQQLARFPATSNPSLLTHPHSHPHLPIPSQTAPLKTASSHERLLTHHNGQQQAYHQNHFATLAHPPQHHHHHHHHHQQQQQLQQQPQIPLSAITQPRPTSRPQLPNTSSSYEFVYNAKSVPVNNNNNHHHQRIIQQDNQHRLIQPSRSAQILIDEETNDDLLHDHPSTQQHQSNPNLFHSNQIQYNPTIHNRNQTFDIPKRTYDHENHFNNGNEHHINNNNNHYHDHHHHEDNEEEEQEEIEEDEEDLLPTNFIRSASERQSFGERNLSTAPPLIFREDIPPNQNGYTNGNHQMKPINHTQSAIGPVIAPKPLPKPMISTLALIKHTNTTNDNEITHRLSKASLSSSSDHLAPPIRKPRIQQQESSKMINSRQNNISESRLKRISDLLNRNERTDHEEKELDNLKLEHEFDRRVEEFNFQSNGNDIEEERMNIIPISTVSPSQNQNDDMNEFDEKLKRRLEQYEHDRQVERVHANRMQAKREADIEARLRKDRDRDNREMHDLKIRRMSEEDRSVEAKKEQARLSKHVRLPDSPPVPNETIKHSSSIGNIPITKDSFENQFSPPIPPPPPARDISFSVANNIKQSLMQRVTNDHQLISPPLPPPPTLTHEGSPTSSIVAIPVSSLHAVERITAELTRRDDFFTNDDTSNQYTPSVIGAQEVYLDPRFRTKRFQQQNGHVNGINKENLNNDASGVTTETMSFRDKLKFFRKPPDQQE